MDIPRSAMLVLLLPTAAAAAQETLPLMTDGRISALTVTVKAFSGQPFGVGIVTVTETNSESWWGPLNSIDLQILGSDAFYPVVERTGLSARQSHESDEMRIYFLFDVDRATKISVLGRTHMLESVSDSIRGARGAFIPIADVSIGKVTTTEVSQYGEFARINSRLWTWLDPATLTLNRQVSDQQE